METFKTERERDLPEVTQQAHGKAGFKFMAPGFYFNANSLAQSFPLHPHYRLLPGYGAEESGIEFTCANKKKQRA